MKGRDLGGDQWEDLEEESGRPPNGPVTTKSDGPEHLPAGVALQALPN